MANPIPAALAANAGKGRKPGSVNKTTSMAKAVIAEAFESMGGVDALVLWACKNDEHRKAFYTSIYPKLLPLQVTGEGGGPVAIQTIERRIVKVT